MTREELVKDIKAIMTEKPRLETVEGTANFIADFIIKDRERVVEPLVEITKQPFLMHGRIGGKHSIIIKAICETLKNAAIDTDK